ncbi:MAG: carbon storage regulator [Pirellulaceae bacterium]|nr:carbon storage regulator [Pirellulaceae bacterium]
MLAERTQRLILERKHGESIVVGLQSLQTKPHCDSLDNLDGGEELFLENVRLRIRVEKASGRRVKLVIEAPNSVQVWREELLQVIEEPVAA